jgi:hypothetical protein
MNEAALAILAEDRKVILFRPRINAVIGRATATILLQQIYFRWMANKRKPFFKFARPCSHNLYKQGDSFTEELAFTRHEFEGARKVIGKRIKNGEERQDEDALVFYWIDANRKTWYAINERAYLKMIDQAYTLEPESDDDLLPESGNTLLPESGNTLLPESGNSFNREYIEDRDQVLGSPPPAENPEPEITKKKHHNIVRPDEVPEPELVEEGNEFGDDPTKTNKPPKYLTPNTELSKRALRACGRKLFAKGEKAAWKKIEKGMFPAASGVVGDYPTEWVMFCIEFAEKKNGRERKRRPSGVGIVISFPNLIKYINNATKRIDWLADNADTFTSGAGLELDGVALGSVGMQDPGLGGLGSVGMQDGGLDDLRKLGIME